MSDRLAAHKRTDRARRVTPRKQGSKAYPSWGLGIPPPVVRGIEEKAGRPIDDFQFLVELTDEGILFRPALIVVTTSGWNGKP